MIEHRTVYPAPETADLISDVDDVGYPETPLTLEETIKLDEQKRLTEARLKLQELAEHYKGRGRRKKAYIQRILGNDNV